MPCEEETNITTKLDAVNRCQRKSNAAMENITSEIAFPRDTSRIRRKLTLSFFWRPPGFHQAVDQKRSIATRISDPEFTIGLARAAPDRLLQQQTSNLPIRGGRAISRRKLDHHAGRKGLGRSCDAHTGPIPCSTLVIAL